MFSSCKFEKSRRIMDTVRLPLLNLLERSFINEIRTVGFSGRKTLFVTKSDEVYGLGPLPDYEMYADDLELRPIPQLHKKNVERFVFGIDVIFILTQNGEVFAWGENSKGQLGIGGLDEAYAPILISSFEGKKVLDIACGFTHTIALCSDQQVYCWGTFGNDSRSVPFHVATNAIGIASSERAAFYVSSNGEVYGKGFVCVDDDANDREYSIGNGSSPRTVSDWTKIEKLVNIEKVVCGKCHAMALSNEGIVFGWGDNEEYQINRQCPKMVPSPKKISFIAEKIIDIAANSQSDLSVAMTESFKIYVWGEYLDDNFSKPYLTLFTSIEEAFNYLSNPSITYKSVTFENVKPNEFLMTRTFGSIFDVQEDSDLTITVQEKPIYVHKAILKARCKYFLAMFSNQWKENDDKVLKIDEYSYASYRSFLSYLYTGEIDITLNNIFELVSIADKYSDDVLLDLIGKKLDNCSIPDEIVRALKEIIKLSPSNFEKFLNGVKMSTCATSKNL